MKHQKKEKILEVLGFKFNIQSILQIESHTLNSSKTSSQDLSLVQILILASNDMIMAESDKIKTLDLSQILHTVVPHIKGSETLVLWLKQPVRNQINWAFHSNLIYLYSIGTVYTLLALHYTVRLKFQLSKLKSPHQDPLWARLPISLHALFSCVTPSCLHQTAQVSSSWVIANYHNRLLLFSSISHKSLGEKDLSREWRL